MAIKYFNDGADFVLKGKRVISRWIKDTVTHEGFTAGEITYIFCSPDKHIEINRKYLGHDYHTDVITFDYSDLEEQKIVSGDIFIAPSTVALNANEYGATPEQEMHRVLVHGVLHLCGYKDKTQQEEKQMREKENFYLSHLLL